MQKFNTVSVESRFIKSILKNTYLPVLPTVRGGDYLVKDAEYTYKNSIIKCTKSGVFTVDGVRSDSLSFVYRLDSNGIKIPNKTSVACTSSAVASPSFICGDGTSSAHVEVVSEFEGNTFVPGITYAFSSSSDAYDVLTHRHLGRYLRWYRDTKNIDLLSMYNCFDGESTTLAHIENGHIVSGNDINHTSWIVPAQLNRRYTIYVSSDTNVSVKGVFISDFGRVYRNSVDGKKFLDEYLTSSAVELTHASYSHPFSYMESTKDLNLLHCQNNFYLLIQTDKSNHGSIVVLEGDYTVRSSRTITSVETTAYADYGRATPMPESSLAIMPSKSVLPYADRLIEFLTQNAITREEDIPLNIGRVQDALGISDTVDTKKDIWDDKLRFMIYNKHFNYVNDYYFKTSTPTPEEIDKKGVKNTRLCVYDENNNLVGLKNCKVRRAFDAQYDITGYVDKDTENTLFRYRSNS